MLTVTQLARQFGLSRTSVLYYERVGLLQPASRSDNGYRWYGEKEVARLEQILAYRSCGLPVASLESVLDTSNDSQQKHILRDHFDALEREIQSLKLQQKAIVQFIEQPELLDNSSMSKERWSDIMRAAGLSDDDMENWHKQFEAMEPQAHQEFLESLQISEQEIDSIRSWSKSPPK